ncbi:MAG: carbohydrate porin [Bermanella sp.]
MRIYILSLIIILLSLNVVANDHDFSFTGYLRSGVGSATDGGDQTCFQVPGVRVKYRLGNECDNYSEVGLSHTLFSQKKTPSTPFKLTYHALMAYIVNADDDFETYSPAFRVNYIEAENVLPNQPQAKLWVGKRFYRRHDIHINDFYFWDNSGPGGGMEDYNLNFANFSYGYLRNSDNTGNAGTTHDFLLSNIKTNQNGKINVGLSLGRADERDSSVNQDSNGWAVNFIHHQSSVLGGYNKLSMQYGKEAMSNPGGRTNSSAHKNDETSRFTNQTLFNPSPSWTGMLVFIYEKNTTNDIGNTWLSAGARPQYHFSEFTSLALELGVDQFKPEGANSRELYKITLAPQLSSGRQFWSRPVLRAFITYAAWNQGAEDAGIDINNVYSDKSGVTYGLQADVWW